MTTTGFRSYFLIRASITYAALSMLVHAPMHADVVLKAAGEATLARLRTAKMHITGPVYGCASPCVDVMTVPRRGCVRCCPSVSVGCSHARPPSAIQCLPCVHVTLAPSSVVVRATHAHVRDVHVKHGMRHTTRNTNSHSNKQSTQQQQPQQQHNKH